MFRIRFAKPVAGRSFEHLPRDVQNFFNDRFDLLAKNPHARTGQLDIHQLWGYTNAWVLRMGREWRAVYAIDGNDVIFIIFGSRKTVYIDLHHLHPPEGNFLSPTS
jgi:mRNA-degrading endonuclease RelE of RelBE toxin-antitoxin system